jgi:hypothetical protein
VAVSQHGFIGGSEEVDTGINQRWQRFFQLWWEKFGSRSMRVWQLAPTAQQAGFELQVPSEPKYTNEEGANPGLTRLGMLLRAKHRHVHGGLRLVSDRIELGWSPKTAGSTYHLEPKDKPRGYAAQQFRDEVGASEE